MCSSTLPATSRHAVVDDSTLRPPPCLTIFVKCAISLTIHLTNLVQLAYLAVVRTHDSSLQSTHQSKRGLYGWYDDERPDAGSAASAGTPHGPDLQRRAVT